MSDAICVKKLLEDNGKKNICRCPHCSEEREKEKEEDRVKENA
jgi:hypothetical protein